MPSHLRSARSRWPCGVEVRVARVPTGARLREREREPGRVDLEEVDVLRYRDNHLSNPTNFPVRALLLAAPARVSVLSHQFGNDLLTNLVIWAFGLVIVARAGVLHMTLTYVASFLLLNTARAAALGQSVLSEIARITRPMHQLSSSSWSPTRAPSYAGAGRKSSWQVSSR